MLTKFLFDSGAYSAWNAKKPIKIKDYCEFLLNHTWIIENHFYVNLDVIDPRDPTEAAEIGLVHFKYLRNHGLNPMPVVHAFEGTDPIRWYLDLGCDYIGISATGAGSAVERPFYTDCFKVFQNSGRPVRVHGFGIGDTKILMNFPFASADTAGPLLAAQKFYQTYIGHLLGIQENEKLAARTYKEMRQFIRHERLIRIVNPGFDFYLAFTPANDWALPALWLVNHRKGLVSYYYLKDANIEQFRRLIENRLAIPMEGNRHTYRLELLSYVRERYFVRVRICRHDKIFLQ